MSRRAAREFVLHLIFAAEYSRQDSEILLENRLEPVAYHSLAGEYELYEHMPSDAQIPYIKEAVKGVIEHDMELDSYIEKYAMGWSVGRISRISKCILRLCMYEVLYMDIPVGAAVNEALELAKQYDSEEAANFINGIMGSFVAKEIQRD